MIADICRYMEQTDDLSLSGVAEKFGYSPEHLSRRFHAEKGISYRSYCDQIRMRRASVLLQREPGNLAFVAERLGYSDESSFIRAFKRMYGITPRVYCQRHLPISQDTGL